MVDIAKKVNKKSELLQQGEIALAATTLMKKGQFKKSVAAGAIGAKRAFEAERTRLALDLEANGAARSSGAAHDGARCLHVA